jgi:hypothetical protein
MYCRARLFRSRIGLSFKNSAVHGLAVNLCPQSLGVWKEIGSHFFATRIFSGSNILTEDF